MGAMDAIQVAYLIYFTVLQSASLFWVYGYPVACAGISLVVVCLHFAFGGWTISQSLQTADRTLPKVLRERYVNQINNVIADFLLTYSLVILSVFLGLHPRPDPGFLVSGLLAAVVGNSFCVLGQISRQANVSITGQTSGQTSGLASDKVGDKVGDLFASRATSLKFHAV